VRKVSAFKMPENLKCIRKMFITPLMLARKSPERIFTEAVFVFDQVENSVFAAFCKYLCNNVLLASCVDL